MVLIEPGLITTKFGEVGAASVGESRSDGPYAEFNDAVAQGTAEVYEGGLAKLGGPPEAVAKRIEKAISARRPKTRYVVTPRRGWRSASGRLLTDRMWDRAMRVQFPRPGSE